MNILELFAGSRCIGRNAEKLGHKVFSVDWEDYEGIDLVIDIGNSATCALLFENQNEDNFTFEKVKMRLRKCSRIRFNQILPKVKSKTYLHNRKPKRDDAENAFYDKHTTHYCLVLQIW